MTNKKTAYCPSCKYFEQDCHPEIEDYGAPCDAFEELDLGGWIFDFVNRLNEMRLQEMLASQPNIDKHEEKKLRLLGNRRRIQ